MIFGIGIGIQFTSGAGIRSLISQLLSSLRSRSTYYENEDDTRTILNDLDKSSSCDNILLLIAGQSNAKGSTEGLPSESYLNQPIPDTYIWTGSQFDQLEVDVNNGSYTNKHGIELNFGYLSQLNRTGKVYIVKVSEGSTGFVDNRWNPGDDLYNELVNDSNAAIAYLDANNISYYFSGLYWNQGEQDTVQGPTATAEQYNITLGAFVSGLRSSITGASNMRFMFTRLSEFYTVRTNTNDLTRSRSVIVRARQVLANTEISNSELINQDDLTHTGDQVHYDSASQNILASRVFSLVNNEITSSNLLEKASILITPTGYDVGSINAIKPSETPFADLTFTRNTTATRIGGDGYITDEAVNVPRISENVWLFEPQATNYATYSNDLTQPFYTKSNSGVGALPIVTANYSISPDGTQNASRLQCDLNGGNTSSDHSYVFNVGAVTGNDGNVSVYLKNNESGSKVVYFRNTFGTIDNVTVTGTWQRFNISNSDTRGLYLGLRGNQGNSDTCDISVYGIQIEDNTFATSIVPANGTSSTRGGEFSSDSGDSTMFNDSEGVLYAELSGLTTNGSNRIISISDGSNNEAVRLKLSSTSNRIDFEIRDGGVSVVGLNYTTSDITAFHKVALKYKSGDCALWVDGVERSTSAVAFSLSGLNELALNQGEGTNPFYGNLKCVAIYKEALTDTELQCLTS